MDNRIKIKESSEKSRIKVSHEASSQYAELAKNWATKSDETVDGIEFSSKYYAQESKKQAEKAKNEAETITETIESANELINGIETAKTELNQLTENSITNIQDEKSSAISSIDEAKTTAVNTVEEAKAQASADLDTEKANAIKSVQELSNIKVATVENAGIVKPDGTTITIADDGTISSVGGGSSSGVEWGNITGTLENQADLQAKLNTMDVAQLLKRMNTSNAGKLHFKNVFTFVWGNVLVPAEQPDGYTQFTYPNTVIKKIKNTGNYDGYSFLDPNAPSTGDDVFNPIHLFITPRPLYYDTDNAPDTPIQVSVVSLDNQRFRLKNYSNKDVVVSYLLIGLAMG